ncbi:MAG: DUF4079 domain-containing protein [Cyanobacteria bacterium J06638_20]
MNLPSFLWLWRIAAWSMGLSLLTYLVLAVSGLRIRGQRHANQIYSNWLRPLHIGLGVTLVSLVLLLLGIGLVGTLGHYGTLGHSAHLPIGLAVSATTLFSAWSASRISPERPWARSLHLGTNAVLFVGFLGVLATGWQVVQKYLP